MRKIKSPYLNNEANINPELKRLQDIEDGKVFPTFEEFFKLCLVYEIEENVNLRKLYPRAYKKFKKDVQDAKDTM